MIIIIIKQGNIMESVQVKGGSIPRSFAHQVPAKDEKAREAERLTLTLVRFQNQTHGSEKCFLRPTYISITSRSFPFDIYSKYRQDAPVLACGDD